MPKIKIGVVSDIVCPWCYIGKRRLEKAMDKLSAKFDFEVEYFPFELNTQIPSQGFDQQKYLAGKFGGEDRYHEITGSVTEVADREGLKFDFSAQKITPNTRRAHRLIQHAKERDKQSAVVEALFKAYFSDGIDLSANENLLTIATNAGIEKTTAEALLNNGDDTEIEMAERQFRELGITGVPFFIVNNKYGISGAQPTETFIKAFEDIAVAQTSPSGEACDVDGTDC